MPRPFTPKVITANALLEGDVIWFTSKDGWTRDMAAAEILTDEAHATLRLLDAERQQNQVVGAYLADVNIDGDTPAPTHFREEFRLRGPSNYPSHGRAAAEV